MNQKIILRQEFKLAYPIEKDNHLPQAYEPAIKTIVEVWKTFIDKKLRKLSDQIELKYPILDTTIQQWINLTETTSYTDKPTKIKTAPKPSFFSTLSRTQKYGALGTLGSIGAGGAAFYYHLISPKLLAGVAATGTIGLLGYKYFDKTKAWSYIENLLYVSEHKITDDHPDFD